MVLANIGCTDAYVQYCVVYSFENMGPCVLLLFLDISSCAKVHVQYYVLDTC